MFSSFLAVTPNLKSIFMEFFEESYGKTIFPRVGLLMAARDIAKIVRLQNIVKISTSFFCKLSLISGMSKVIIIFS